MYYKFVYIDVIKFGTILRVGGESTRNSIMSSKITAAMDTEFTDYKKALSFSLEDKNMQLNLIRTGQWKNSYTSLMSCKVYAIVETNVREVKALESFQADFMEICPIMQLMIENNITQYIDDIDWFIPDESGKSRYIEKMEKIRHGTVKATYSCIEVSYLSISIIYPCTLNMIVINSSIHSNIYTLVSAFVDKFVSNHSSLEKSDVFAVAGSTNNLVVVYFNQSKVSLSSLFNDDSFFSDIHKIIV